MHPTDSSISADLFEDKRRIPREKQRMGFKMSNMPYLKI